MASEQKYTIAEVLATLSLRWELQKQIGFDFKNSRNVQKVAMDLNISREALSYYENGKRGPYLALLVAMSKYYNVSINYLIAGEEFQKR